MAATFAERIDETDAVHAGRVFERIAHRFVGGGDREALERRVGPVAERLVVEQLREHGHFRGTADERELKNDTEAKVATKLAHLLRGD